MSQGRMRDATKTGDLFSQGLNKRLPPRGNGFKRGRKVPNWNSTISDGTPLVMVKKEKKRKVLYFPCLSSREVLQSAREKQQTAACRAVGNC